jgi:hypothetical protein
MPRKNRPLRPKDAAPAPDCRRPATNGGFDFRTAQKSLLSASNSGLIRGIPVYLFSVALRCSAGLLQPVFWPFLVSRLSALPVQWAHSDPLFSTALV